VIIIRLLMWLLLGYVAYLTFKGFMAKKEIPKETPSSGDDTHRDPICGVYVEEDILLFHGLSGKVSGKGDA
jgi:hypothetical protein